MTDKIDEAQMAADFASIPDRSDGPYQRARKIVAENSSRIGAAHMEGVLIDAIAAEIALAELRATPHRTDIERILRSHFWTGEPGDIEAIEGAKQAFAALFQQMRGIGNESVETEPLMTANPKARFDNLRGRFGRD